MKSFAEGDDVGWTVTHGFFANNGWFVIKFQQTGDILPDGSKITMRIIRLLPDISGIKSASDMEIGEPTPGSPSLSELPHATMSGKQSKKSHFLAMGAGLKNEKDREWYDKFVGHNDMLPGRICPCLPNRTEANFHPMSIPDIAAHFVGFWNGRF